MPPSELPPHTSASQLACYASCPRKYMYRYVVRADAEYRSIGLALGSAVHGAVGWWFEERLGGVEPNVEDASQVLHADLDAALSYPNVRWGALRPEALHEEAEGLLRLFLGEHGSLEVVESEKPFEMPLIDPDTGETMPRPLIGFFDLQLEDGRVVELKTTRRAYSAVDCQTNLQFAAYRKAQRLFAPADVTLLALVRTKKPRIQRVDLPSDRENASWFVGAAVAIERAIAARQFPPAPSAMCSACEYRGACMGQRAEDGHAEAA